MCSKKPLCTSGIEVVGMAGQADERGQIIRRGPDCLQGTLRLLQIAAGDLTQLQQ